MTYLVLGLVLFFGTHFIAIVAPTWRSGMIAKMGIWPWRGLYSLVAILCVTVGAGLASWQDHSE